MRFKFDSSKISGLPKNQGMKTCGWRWYKSSLLDLRYSSRKRFI